MKDDARKGKMENKQQTHLAKFDSIILVIYFNLFFLFYGYNIDG